MMKMPDRTFGSKYVDFGGSVFFLLIIKSFEIQFKNVAEIKIFDWYIFKGLTLGFYIND